MLLNTQSSLSERKKKNLHTFSLLKRNEPDRNSRSENPDLLLIGIKINKLANANLYQNIFISPGYFQYLATISQKVLFDIRISPKYEEVITKTNSNLELL